MDIDRVSSITFGTWRNRTVVPLERTRVREFKSSADAAGEDYEVTMTGLNDSSSSEEERRDRDEPDPQALKSVLPNDEDDNLHNPHLDLQV